MQIYLPIAELPLHVLLPLGLGAVVGFLSGMFGIGGGFLMTPLLIFSGIPPAIAVATEANQITASSVSGMIAHWRRRAVDFKMGSILMVGGIGGSVVGVSLFRELLRTGQVDLMVYLTYVVLLGGVGFLMMVESVRSLYAARTGRPRPARRAGQHNWIHGLPFKMRFHRSRLYISVIPPLVLGFVVGLLAAIMGVGGGFIMVPAMIYLLRMPTMTVVGTSLFQIIFVTGFVTILHAVENQTVDVVLALLLIIGGVIGAQFGVRAGEKLRGDQLRGLLALVVLGVCARFVYDLTVEPVSLYSIAPFMGGNQ
ncbi:MAG: sulfite exporter TauE/SafE family protein [Parvularculales bacterium]